MLKLTQGHGNLHHKLSARSNPSIRRSHHHKLNRFFSSPTTHQTSSTTDYITNDSERKMIFQPFAGVKGTSIGELHCICFNNSNIKFSSKTSFPRLNLFNMRCNRKGKGLSIKKEHLCNLLHRPSNAL